MKIGRAREGEGRTKEEGERGKKAYLQACIVFHQL